MFIEGDWRAEMGGEGGVNWPIKRANSRVDDVLRVSLPLSPCCGLKEPSSWI